MIPRSRSPVAARQPAMIEVRNTVKFMIREYTRRPSFNLLLSNGFTITRPTKSQSERFGVSSRPLMIIILRIGAFHSILFTLRNNIGFLWGVIFLDNIHQPIESGPR